jgi:hypothetical protein
MLEESEKAEIYPTIVHFAVVWIIIRRLGFDCANEAGDGIMAQSADMPSIKAPDAKRQTPRPRPTATTAPKQRNLLLSTYLLA